MNRVEWTSHPHLSVPTHPAPHLSIDRTIYENNKCAKIHACAHNLINKIKPKWWWWLSSSFHHIFYYYFNFYSTHTHTHNLFSHIVHVFISTLLFLCCRCGHQFNSYFSVFIQKQAGSTRTATTTKQNKTKQTHNIYKEWMGKPQSQE